MSTGAHRTIRILHIDDEQGFTDVTQTFLEREDDRFAVETTPSTEEGLQRIADRPPDVVVSDYNMPGMDGLEFLDAVREEYPDLPFILFTGRGSEAVASEAISAGVTDYLQKQSGSQQYELLANRIENAVQARREAQRADRQEQLMRLTEFAGDTGGWELDRESNRVLLTAGTRRIIGRPDQTEISLQNAIDLFHPEDHTKIQQTLTEAFETGEEIRDTWRLKQEDDGVRVLDMIVTPVVENGEVTKLRGAGNDITDDRERQQELESERRFIEQAIDALNDLFYVMEPDGSFRRWNSKVPEITGYHESKLADMQADRLFPGDGGKTIATAIETTLADGQATVETDLVTADGDQVPYELTGARLTDGDGTTTGIVGLGRDLTERRQRERRFQALVEESNDVISIVDPQGVFQYHSPSLERVLGYDPEEAIGDTAWEYVHPEDRADLMESLERGVANPDLNPVVEYRAQHADGSWRWMEARGNNQLDNPAVEGYVVNSRHISDRKHRERQLERERQRYTTLFETLPTPVLHAKTKNNEPVVRTVNTAFEDTFGYDTETIRGEPIQEYILPDGRADDAKRINSQVLAEGEAQTEVERETTNGVRTFRLNVSTRNTENGEHEGYAVYTDITELKQS